MTSVLIVVSAADRWTLKDGTGHPTGYWAEELAEPHKIFASAGWDITIATPGGVAPTVDRVSLGFVGGLPAKTRAVAEYLRQHDSALAHPKVLADIDPADYDVVFYPGGHGPMEDLAVDADSGRLLANVLDSGRPLALLCHAPAATLAAHRDDGTWPFEGYRMTALSNAEERMNLFARKAPWLLQDRLIEAGAIYRKGRVPLRPFLQVDRNLYTGQNPASSAMLAHKLVTDHGSPALHVSVSRVIQADPLTVRAAQRYHHHRATQPRNPCRQVDHPRQKIQGLQPHWPAVSVEHRVQGHRGRARTHVRIRCRLAIEDLVVLRPDCAKRRNRGHLDDDQGATSGGPCAGGSTHGWRP